ncbi:hypothetical protein OLMES_0497 [Oleiphilus messinensis]|uniref:Uncharacterized protein n=1 Tax=Oleiphilus messinensis TaxID=141451 RepID=A0A1Y0I2W0_9GAMM|nr:hypothetical protein [Oleiphilus messinensis]ARU54600.1 hypothetical protein OLMES_0497 [Oleiphilus messinensis]
MPIGRLIHQESDITAGELKVNDAYDIKLRHLPSGDYELIIHMKLQFFFKDAGTLKWASAEKALFLKNWKNEINNAWGGRTIKLLSRGKKVLLNFEFTIQEGGWMFDHWEITVNKIKKGTFATSYVVPKMGNVVLDSEDFTPVNKGGRSPQRGVIHEFGHMLGLLDEYKKTNPHSTDTSSVMHSAELVRPRHDSTIMKWLNNTLALKKIK